MATLNALKKAPILNEAGVAIGSGYSVVSSNPAICSVARLSGGGSWMATGVTGGTAVLTATRLLDNATADLDVEVIAAAPFSISLGAEVAA